MKAIGIVFTTMWKHEVLKQAQVRARDQASARRQWVGLLKELIKLPTRGDNNQSAREVQGTGQARSMQRNTKQDSQHT